MSKKTKIKTKKNKYAQTKKRKNTHKNRSVNVQANKPENIQTKKDSITKYIALDVLALNISYMIAYMITEACAFEQRFPEEQYSASFPYISAPAFRIFIVIATVVLICALLLANHVNKEYFKDNIRKELLNVSLISFATAAISSLLLFILFPDSVITSLPAITAGMTLIAFVLYIIFDMIIRQLCKKKTHNTRKE